MSGTGEAYADLIVQRIQEFVTSGRLPANRWTIEGPAAPQTNVDGVATTFVAQVGESEVVLRRFDVYPRHSNNDWRYTIAVTRNDVTLAHAVTDDSASALGELVEAVTTTCRPTVEAERKAAISDFGEL